MTHAAQAPASGLLAYASANLPRYTSYPTAPHFMPLTEAQLRGWLAETKPDHALSLYVHVPFCASLCWYCGCHTAVTRSAARIARYGAALAEEARLLRAALPAHGGVAALHLGGGTPTALGAEGLIALGGALHRFFPFQPQAEIAAELDPRTLDTRMIDALARMGLTRASLGVQDISPKVQRLIGRVQPAEQVVVAVERLRAAGIGGINMDLIYGLPGQGVEEVAASARFAAENGADRVAVFGYAHVPWMKSHQKAIKVEDLPDAALRMAQAEAAERALNDAGYVAIGLDHFARQEDAMARAAASGRLRRNFQGYTTDDAPVLLGLGASAIGRCRAGFFQNIADERGWLAAVEAGRLPIARGRAFTHEDLIRAQIIERIMCDQALDLALVPTDLLASARAKLDPLMSDGLVVESAGRLAMTTRGARFLRHFAACFDAYLAPAATRHSAAV
ncbi:MAG: oxygen-independent coproporphyrinogen III oxidase [Roseomonas sp.]|nr:oxygen-independent coproporphyrinogen III oxidase [Roseomonas sp.]MCA3381895.1 oxygen-independent coproporphyrinogen III oxidase [Roseomonas sp.]